MVAQALTLLLPRRRHLLAVLVWGVACLAAVRVAIADPAIEATRACEAASPQEAAILADRLFAKAEYQHAGSCYEAAGDLVHANLAYLKAVGPQGEDTARVRKAQQEAAKALFARVGQAFRGGH